MPQRPPCFPVSLHTRSKRLRSLASDSLPLRVVSVQPLAAVLRHAAAFPPLPHLLAGAPRDALASDHVARCLQPVELLCQLEGSGGRLGGLVGQPAGQPSPSSAALLAAPAMHCQLAPGRVGGREHRQGTSAAGPARLPNHPTQCPSLHRASAGKWPDHPEAFNKMKAAVGCQLAALLHQTLGMDAQVGGPRRAAALEAASTARDSLATLTRSQPHLSACLPACMCHVACWPSSLLACHSPRPPTAHPLQASEDYVDVLTDGFAFRLLLATERDAAMQQKALQLSEWAGLGVGWGVGGGPARKRGALQPSGRAGPAHLLAPGVYTSPQRWPDLHACFACFVSP